MQTYLFSLIVSFCSPVECQEFVIDHSLTQQDCIQAVHMAEGLYDPIPIRVLYKHYADKWAAEVVNGYPKIVDREIKCTVDV